MQRWYKWLEEMKKKDEKEMREEMRQLKVTQMIKSAEGSAGLLHKISKPAAWMGEAHFLVNKEEDARLLDRCEAKRKEWAKQWLCDEEVQNVEEKPWKIEEKCGGCTTKAERVSLAEVSRLYEAKTGVGCDGFHLGSSWT